MSSHATDFVVSATLLVVLVLFSSFSFIFLFVLVFFFLRLAVAYIHCLLVLMLTGGKMTGRARRRRTNHAEVQHNDRRTAVPASPSEAKHGSSSCRTSRRRRISSLFPLDCRIRHGVPVHRRITTDRALRWHRHISNSLRD